MKLIKNNIFLVLLFCATLSSVAFVVFGSRQIFFNVYEPEYFENLYYHSQWIYPGSTRGISDGPLYQFVGYRLVEGENPFNINYETPPFGKYLYGLSAKYLSNPYWISMFLYLGSLIIFFLFSKNLFRDTKNALISLFLFATTPFVASQLRETMLDLPLMFLYLIHTMLFLKYLSSKKLGFLVLSGIFLGLATATKPGVYTLPVLTLGLTLIFLSKGKFLKLILYPGTVFAGYVLAYFPVYFIRHPNPVPWLRLHVKSINFYLDPEGRSINYLNQWMTIFTNSYQGFWEGGSKMLLSDWSPVLPAGTIASIIVLILAIKRRQIEWIYLSALTLVFLTVNTFLSFWPRYLMPVIPFFILLSVFLLKKYAFTMLVLALLNLPFIFNSLAPGDVAGDAQASARFISTRAYRELYRSLTPESKRNTAEQEFIKIYEDFLDRLGVRTIEVSVGNIQRLGNQGNIRFKILYDTKYGKLSHEPRIKFLRVNNQWKTVWSWDYLWEGLTPDSKIIADEKHIPFLRLEDRLGNTIAVRGNWKTAYIIPRVMFDWGKFIALLADATGKSYQEVENKVRQTVPDHYPRFVGYLDIALRQEAIERALKIPGVTLQDIEYAILAESVSPSKEILESINNLYKNSPELFYAQAEVYLEDHKGKKTQIPFQKISQEDVIVKL